MHLGATIRLLRVDAGLSLRDLARRIGVSSAYLSRVENGLDAAPTPERLAAIARELGVPPTLLMDVAHRVSPFVAHYLEQVPGAGMLFLEMARRGLSGPQLARVREFLDAEFPMRAAGSEAPVPALVPLLAPERMVLRLTCAALEDALDVAAGRLVGSCPGMSAPWLVAELKRREAEASSMVGNGVAVPHAIVEHAAPVAAVVTLAKPLKAETPDGLPLRLLVVLVGGERGRAHLVRLAHVARLASHGLAERLADEEQPQQLLSRLTELEALR
ncbi:PTS sugar transporter subunit IIA [Archangium violaceum]|uniref:helix-turn-helix domain-containing protein n=1 Tax=Archangium violaceum TaxID=83451 RepID=UPI001951C60F|nr:helix-turn-helix domain-containing protein [Archangium violaceum]QRO00897.1 PTS sugar transporter subunit IIA [Archangium violaceum]